MPPSDVQQRSSKEHFVGPRDKYSELEFPLGYQLLCLNGQSRALTAAKVLLSRTEGGS